MKPTKLQVRIAKLRWLAGKDDCVGDILSKKKDEGMEIDDQAIAIALSECGESKTQKNSKISTKLATLKLKTIKTKLAAEGDPSSSQSQGSPDGPHFTLKKIKRKGFPPGRGVKERVGIMKLASNQGDKFAKYYLIDSLDTNGNGWGVTDPSIPNNIQSFVGMPFVVTAKEWITDSPYEDQFDHPFIPTNQLDLIMAHQEHFRVGNIIKVAKDEDQRWYAMIAIDEKYRHLPLPPFCSPAIYQINPHEPENQITQWIGLHLAGLDRDPAYGPRVALLRGSCTGEVGQCTHQFRMAKQKSAVGLEPVKAKPISPSGITETKLDEDEEECECEKNRKKLSKLMRRFKKANDLKKNTRKLKKTADEKGY